MYCKLIVIPQKYRKLFNQKEYFEFFAQHAPIGSISDFKELVPYLNFNLVGDNKRGLDLCDTWSCLSFLTLQNRADIIEKIHIVKNPVFFDESYKQVPENTDEGRYHCYLEIRIKKRWHVFDRTIPQFNFAKKYRYGVFSKYQDIPEDLAIYYNQNQKVKLTREEINDSLTDLLRQLKNGKIMKYRNEYDRDF